MSFLYIENYNNLYNYNENQNLYSFDDLFKNVPDNVDIYINENNSLTIFYQQINNTKCYAIDDINNWKLKQIKIINNINECINKCNDSDIYKYEYNGKCYENCTNGFLYDDNDSTIKCKCELEKCLVCPQVALNKKLCTVCNENYYPKENDPLNLGEYITISISLIHC